MRVFVLASGSGGNASLYESRGTRVLVDAGVGPRVLESRLKEAGASGMPHAIIVTHAHSDHIGHSERIAARLGIPIYMTESTLRRRPPGKAATVRLFSPRQPFAIGALTISPLPLPHDAAQVALVLSDGERRAAIVTDLGEVPPGLPQHIEGCDVLLIESNHDVAMLERGPYPAHLKRRILSARGHLSNVQTHALLRAASSAAHTVVLMHLSKTNNRPDIALECARDALAGRRVRLDAAPPDGVMVLDATLGPPDVAIKGAYVPASGSASATASVTASVTGSASAPVSASVSASASVSVSVSVPVSVRGGATTRELNALRAAQAQARQLHLPFLSS